MLLEDCGGGRSPQRESHHLRLQNALERLDMKIDRLAKLREEIASGQNPEKAPTAAKPIRELRTLSETLKEAPDILTDYADRINGLVDDIRQLIF